MVNTNFPLGTGGYDPYRFGLLGNDPARINAIAKDVDAALASDDPKETQRALATMSGLSKSDLQAVLQKLSPASRERLRTAMSDPSAAPTPAEALGGGKGLTAEQKRNAKIIIDEGRRAGASDRDIQIALMTAMQESNLRNLRGGDRDSGGLFQQRPSQGWGTRKQITDPHYAAAQFYKHLLRVDDREQMSLAQAAQTVQRSAYPDAYAKWERLAGRTLAELG
ncbi:MAG: hypothetical protein U1E65_00335 [Myxococcota bacterium]